MEQWWGPEKAALGTPLPTHSQRKPLDSSLLGQQVPAPSVPRRPRGAKRSAHLGTSPETTHVLGGPQHHGPRAPPPLAGCGTPNLGQDLGNLQKEANTGWFPSGGSPPSPWRGLQSLRCGALPALRGAGRGRAGAGGRPRQPATRGEREPGTEHVARRRGRAAPRTQRTRHVNSGAVIAPPRFPSL